MIKKLILTALMMMFVGATAMSQSFTGVSWEGNPGLIYGGQVVGISDRVNSFAYMRAALDKDTLEGGLQTHTSASVKIVYSLFEYPAWTLYLHGGGSVDWTDPSLNQSDVMYVSQSIGGTFAHDAPPFIANLPIINQLYRPRLWIGVEYRGQFTEVSLFPNWLSLGAGLSWGV